MALSFGQDVLVLLLVAGGELRDLRFMMASWSRSARRVRRSDSTPLWKCDCTCSLAKSVSW
jgi:hypothetical protein